jgi:hypothetical protein
MAGLEAHMAGAWRARKFITFGWQFHSVSGGSLADEVDITGW